MEMLAHQFRQRSLADSARALRVDVHRDRFGNANRVSELHLASISKTGGDNVLGDVARHVRGRAIDLRRIFAGERAATVRRIAAVGVDDDLATGQTGIALRTTGNESTGRIDVILRVVVQQIAGNSVSDNVFANLSAQLFVFNFRRVLRRDDDGVNAKRPAVAILNRDLRFAVWPQVGKLAGLAYFGQPSQPAGGPTESATASVQAFHYRQTQTSSPGRRRRRCPRPWRCPATADQSRDRTLQVSQSKPYLARCSRFLR